MADDGQENSERTEEPTQKRLDDALERGDVVKSQEVNTWFIIAAATLILMSFSGAMSARLTAGFVGFLANAGTMPADGPGLMAVLRRTDFAVLAAVSVPFLLLMLAALGGNLIQHRLVWSTESLMPKLEKISPMAGAKRLFSKQSLMNFVKGLVKLGLVGAVMTALLWPERFRLESLVRMDIPAVLVMAKSLSLQLLGFVVAVLALIAAADYLFQYRVWHEKQKMSLRDLKEEFKQSEGDPHIKGKLRRMRLERSRKRMMADVPKASVVIMNPTHFAVALQYDRGMSAPVCVAKGLDRVALKIREIAEQHDIPVVENPPLARALHATVEIEQEIPAEHYKAVADVISFVMRLRRKRA